MKIKSYAKINLTLDVKGILDNGFHEVEMIMQQIGLCDELTVEWEEQEGVPFNIALTTNRDFLPVDSGNLAYRAAQIMQEQYGQDREGTLTIHIEKNIPVAAGLAGGSGNGAAVVHAVNCLWDLKLSLKELCDAGAMFGSDVPFCVMGQAAANDCLKEMFAGDPLACHCALATGRGTELKPLAGLDAYVTLSKPPVSVSTAAVYKGIDNEVIPERPDQDAMISALLDNDMDAVGRNLVNVLENFTLKQYPLVVYTKNKMSELCPSGAIVMSGSGPTVFCLCTTREDAEKLCLGMKVMNEESFWTHTTV